jgi:PilZ domain
MSSSERRIDPRVNIRVPLRFRILNNPGATEQNAESENISQRGIYFTTAVPLKVGTPLEVSLRMPRELMGKSASEVRCVARVVHVHANSLLGSKAGIGLHIERYEAKAVASERWTS